MNKNEISLEFVNKPIERASNENVYGSFESKPIFSGTDEYNFLNGIEQPLKAVMTKEANEYQNKLDEKKNADLYVLNNQVSTAMQGIEANYDEKGVVPTEEYWNENRNQFENDLNEKYNFSEDEKRKVMSYYDVEHSNTKFKLGKKETNRIQKEQEDTILYNTQTAEVSLRKAINSGIGASQEQIENFYNLFDQASKYNPAYNPVTKHELMIEMANNEAMMFVEERLKGVYEEVENGNMTEDEMDDLINHTLNASLEKEGTPIAEIYNKYGADLYSAKEREKISNEFITRYNKVKFDKKTANKAIAEQNRIGRLGEKTEANNGIFNYGSDKASKNEENINDNSNFITSINYVAPVLLEGITEVDLKNRPNTTEYINGERKPEIVEGMLFEHVMNGGDFELYKKEYKDKVLTTYSTDKGSLHFFRQTNAELKLNSFATEGLHKLAHLESAESNTSPIISLNKLEQMSSMNNKDMNYLANDYIKMKDEEASSIYFGSKLEGKRPLTVKMQDLKTKTLINEFNSTNETVKNNYNVDGLTRRETTVMENTTLRYADTMANQKFAELIKSGSIKEEKLREKINEEGPIKALGLEEKVDNFYNAQKKVYLAGNSLREEKINSKTTYAPIDSKPLDINKMSKTLSSTNVMIEERNQLLITKDPTFDKENTLDNKNKLTKRVATYTQNSKKESTSSFFSQKIFLAPEESSKQLQSINIELENGKTSRLNYTEYDGENYEAYEMKYDYSDNKIKVMKNDIVYEVNENGTLIEIK